MSMILFITIVQAVFIIMLGIFMAKFRIWKPKRTCYFVSIYIACGLVAFVYLIFASRDIEKAESIEVLERQLAENKQLTESLKLRDFSVLKKEHLKFTKTFEPTAEDVTVNRDGELRYIHTVINWVDTQDDTITASYYETPIYLNRVYVTPYIKQPNITFSNNTINIQDENIRVIMRSIDMSVQMLDHVENLDSSSDSVDRLIGNRILYLNVPKHFNIIDGGGWLE